MSPEKSLAKFGTILCCQDIMSQYIRFEGSNLELRYWLERFGFNPANQTALKNLESVLGFIGRRWLSKYQYDKITPQMVYTYIHEFWQFHEEAEHRFHITHKILCDARRPLDK